MLTGRWKQLETIKQYGGISGFLRRDESPFDVWGAGHASTSLSAALGFAKARDLRGGDEEIVAVIGDGALTGGMALEAMLNAADLKTDITVVLNDNKMSIAENVGAMSTYLAKLRLQPLYQRVERRVKRSLKNHHLLYDLAAGAKHAATHFAAPGNTGLFFEELGFQYIGPIDGHDTEFLIDVFEHARQIKGPVVLHVLTTKGKGYESAEQDARQFHAVTRSRSRTASSRKSRAASPTRRRSSKRLMRWPRPTKAWWRSPRPCPTERALPSFSQVPGPLFRRRELPSSTPLPLRRAWPPRASRPSARFTQRSCSAPLTRLFTMSPCKSAGRVRH
jgi:1-deoxy-D-xylulose-5-phosphate synthase